MDGITILSAVARLSGGTFEPVLEKTQEWRKSGKRQPLNRQEEAAFVKQYLTSLLRCGKPSSIPDERWFLKCLSNDQTAFSGFTSLVDVVDEEQMGYDGRVRLLPQAAFVEPFILRDLYENDQRMLVDLCGRLQRRDSTEIADIGKILCLAEDLTYRMKFDRPKGKFPLFFYSVTDRPFLVPRPLYQRMIRATEIAVEGISVAASRLEGSGGSLEKALFTAQDEEKPERQFFTGSIDFMVYEDDIYLIDVGSPAVGYIVDVVKASSALGRAWDFGLEALAQAAGGEITVFRRNADDLGFFLSENTWLVDNLRRKGVTVEERVGYEGEVVINGKVYPTPAFDYLSRNQPLRNAILQAMSLKLGELGVRVPASMVLLPERKDMLCQFYDQNRLGDDYGLLVKKKVFFREFRDGSGYFKPLVVPLWDREFKNDRGNSTLVEQFIPSLVDVDVTGDQRGLRSYEIRLYFCGGAR